MVPQLRGRGTKGRVRVYSSQASQFCNVIKVQVPADFAGFNRAYRMFARKYSSLPNFNKVWRSSKGRQSTATSKFPKEDSSQPARYGNHKLFVLEVVHRLGSFACWLDEHEIDSVMATIPLAMLRAYRRSCRVANFK